MRELTLEQMALVAGGRGLLSERLDRDEVEVECFCAPSGSGPGSPGSGFPGSGSGGGVTDMGTITVYGTPSSSSGGGVGILGLYISSGPSGLGGLSSVSDPSPSEPDEDEDEEEMTPEELKQMKIASEAELKRNVVGKATGKLLEHKKLEPEDVLGKNSITGFEFDVDAKGIFLSAEHKHYVHVDENGKAWILSGGKGEGGKISISFDKPEEGEKVMGANWLTGKHGVSDIKHEHRFKTIASGPETKAIWEKMVKKAQEINDADLDYNALFQNSNSVARTLANAGGLPLFNVPGDERAPGSNNDLNDEIQAPPREYSPPTQPVLSVGGSGNIPPVPIGGHVSPAPANDDTTTPSDTPTAATGTGNTVNLPASPPIPASGLGAPAGPTPLTPEEIARMTTCVRGPATIDDEEDEEEQQLPPGISLPTMPPPRTANCR